MTKLEKATMTERRANFYDFVLALLPAIVSTYLRLWPLALIYAFVAGAFFARLHDGWRRRP